MLASNYSYLCLDLTLVIIDLLINYLLYCHNFKTLKVNTLSEFHNCTYWPFALHTFFNIYILYQCHLTV